MTTVVFGGDNSSPSTGASTYNRINAVYPSSWTSTESLRSSVVPSAFTLSNFYVELDTAPGAGTSYAFTVIKNGAATSLTATVSDTNTSATSIANSVSFVAGDTVSFQCTPSGTPASNSRQSWNFLATMNDLTVPMLSGFGAASASATQYTSLGSGHTASTGWSATESDMQIIAPTSGTLSNLRVRFNIAPGSGRSYQYTLMVNGVATALDTTVNGTSTTASDTTHSVNINAGDTLTMRSLPTGTPATASNISFGVMFTPTTPGESFFGFGSANLPSTTATNYEGVNGIGNNSWTASETNRILTLGPYTVKAFYVKVGTAPGSGTARTLTMRQAGANTTAAVTLSDSATTGNVNTTVTYAQGESFALQSTVSGTPAAATGGVHTGVLLYATPTITTSFTPIIMVY